MELFLVFIFGTLFGSFLNVVILRIPKDESVMFPASHCFSCNTPLKPWHNIPLISWIFLGGKCSFCKAPVSIQYPAIEFLSGMIFFIIAYKMGITLSSTFTALAFLVLLALSMIDFKYKTVPDSLNLLALLLAVLSAYSLDMLIVNLQNALLFAGGFTLLRFALSYVLTSAAYKKAKRNDTPWTKHYHRYPFVEAMGEADIMIAATMGALLGLKLTLFAIFLAAVLALPVMLLVMNRSAEEQRVPFIPFLALATFITYLLDSQIYNYLENLYA
ncbi:prepilin peptidase [Sulfurimonas sp. HSL-1716]|uniref:prepilin peptidase n=1 Tax=Hydrocurvibacter sulfurireducens TaxID=3131937 RepID=UPI0031F7EF90